MSSSKVFKRFLNQSVGVIMKSVRGSQVLNESTVVEGNVVIEGILLDEDAEYFYLGKTDQEINDALKKEDVVRIFNITEETELEFGDDIDGDIH